MCPHPVSKFIHSEIIYFRVHRFIIDALFILALTIIFAPLAMIYSPMKMKFSLIRKEFIIPCCYC